MKRLSRLLLLLAAAAIGCAPSVRTTHPTVSLPEGAERVTVPLKRGFDHLFVTAHIHGEAVLCHVDSGAPVNILDIAVANKLRLGYGPTGRLSGVGGSQLCRSRIVRRLRVDDVTLGPHLAIGYDLAGFRAVTGGGVNGILGSGLLSRMPVTLDYPAATLTFHRRGSFRPPAGAAAFPLQVRGGKPFVRGTVNGKAAGWFLLDTGHSGGADIHKAFAKAKGISLPVRFRTSTAGFGGTADREGGKLDSLAVLGRTFPGALAKLVDGKADRAGAIGSTVLRHFRLTFDFAAGKLWAQYVPLEPVEAMVARKADLEAKDFLRHTALSLAAYHNDLERAEALIDAGADLNARSKRDYTPLLMSLAGGALETARMLIERGADVRALGDDGATALMYAAFGGDVELVEMLLARGANVNARNKVGRTPLWLARNGKHERIAQILRAAGAKE